MTVSLSGTVTFRYDYRFNGRRETLTLGRYGPDGISLAMACELLLDARKTVLKGISPALEKQREKRRVVAIKTFGTAKATGTSSGSSSCLRMPNGSTTCAPTRGT